MSTADDPLSPRLARIVDRLPLREGLRVLEIGCGPGAAARAVARRVGGGEVLGIDRSARAIEGARRGARRWGLEQVLSFECAAIEEFERAGAAYDLVFGNRVGVLDGRHPGSRALERVAALLAPGGRLYVDGTARTI